MDTTLNVQDMLIIRRSLEAYLIDLKQLDQNDSIKGEIGRVESLHQRIGDITVL